MSIPFSVPADDRWQVFSCTQDDVRAAKHGRSKKDLRMGEALSPQYMLDLHREGSGDACLALIGFLNGVSVELASEGLSETLVCVQTGKGKEGEGVLRSQMPQWLMAHAAVMAFRYADPKHGGKGSFYVWVKAIT